MALVFNASRPHTWYPLARKKVRKVILHVGPTNSGKTYHALKRLELSSSGMGSLHTCNLTFFHLLFNPGFVYDR